MTSAMLHLPPQTRPRDRMPSRDRAQTAYRSGSQSAAEPTLGQRPVVPGSTYQDVAQYAFPVRQKSLQSQHIHPQHNNVTNEHTLRRKTPTATLSAGYDASPVHRGIQAPAAKRLFMSTMAGASTDGITSIDLRTQPWQSLTQHAISPAPYTPNTFLQPSLFGVHKQSYRTTFGASQQTPNPLPSMDSVLNQTYSVQDPSYYYQSGSTVPTVLPANYQHYPAPSASIGGDLYGPYWPDGAFIPYRPAPTRDPRFHSQFGPMFLGGGNHDKDPHGGYRHNDTLMHLKHSGDAGTRSFKDFGVHIPSPYATQLPAIGSVNEPIIGLPYPSQQYQDRSTVIRTPIGPEWNTVTSSRPYDMHLVGMGRQPGNVQFKDRVFQWAHSVYVELLASIQRRQRANPYRADPNARRASKPSIYPKPPRQPGFEVTSQYSTDQAHPHKSPNSHPPSDIGMTESGAPGNTRQSASTLQQQRQSWQDDLMLQPFSGHHAQHHSTIRRASSSAISAMFSSPQTHADLESKAMNALEMLENLCQESNEEWIDGMLLAGCLAHGVGDYEKAIRLYQRILDRDRDHVEGLSNIAASLVSLNRKEEAANFWMQAVRIRPGHFEAVEHLIALLCSSHRGKEALRIIEMVETSLKLSQNGEYLRQLDPSSEIESEAESISTMESVERGTFEGDDIESTPWDKPSSEAQIPGYGSSGYKIPGIDNGRILSLIHAKANMLFGLRDYQGTAAAFEEAILVATGRCHRDIRDLIDKIQRALANAMNSTLPPNWHQSPQNPILILPEKALETCKLLFPPTGDLPGLQYLFGKQRVAAISTTSNALLCLAKIYQDGMSQSGLSGAGRALDGVKEVLALYYLSISLHPSASTANNIGLLLTGVQHLLPPNPGLIPAPILLPDLGIAPGSPTAVALAFYNYGLYLDNRHSHLYTNLGSLLKDVGQVSAAVRMYEQAVQCEGDFDIALANLANALKDQGRMAEAIKYYQRAVQANPDFAEAVCGLATSLNSVCSWVGRGGVYGDHGRRDLWHVNEAGMLVDARANMTGTPGWMKNVIETVEKQLRNAEVWGQGILTSQTIDMLLQHILGHSAYRRSSSLAVTLRDVLLSWHGRSWEGARVVKLIERASRCLVWQWYQDRYVHGKEFNPDRYRRPALPIALTTPMTPTVLPFHAFTTPLSAKQVRLISQQNALRMSVSTLRSSWLPQTVFPPPPPPSPHLNVGYVSSDFNNHPLAHLMQSVFGFHDTSRVRAFCYATTPSDGSIHRKKIKAEAPVFHDASTWSLERLVNQIVHDEIHILINLNGYTRGARNEVFAARPAPISMSFMGFAGTLGAEWCDYLLSDEICIPHETLMPWRRNVTLEDKLHPDANAEDAEDWVYNENIIFTRASFFCCDHRQSGPDTDRPYLTWDDEQRRRWQMRKEIFPNLADDTIIFGNFNQLYKIDPTTFRTWLRILASVPNSILWLLRFPDLGEQHLLSTARSWAGDTVAARVIFTDVASKTTHISRARVVDLFLDTPECNAHTTSADVAWSGTPVLTFGRRAYKMCSRMAGSIISSALPEGPDGDQARKELLATSEEEYEETAIILAQSLKYAPAYFDHEVSSTTSHGHQDFMSGMALKKTSAALVQSRKPQSRAPTRSDQYQSKSANTATYHKGMGRLMDLRQMLWRNRWSSRLFDTKRWVRDLETGYEEAWRRWVRGEGGDIWL